MPTFLLCETCCDYVDLGDTAILPEGSPHAGHYGVAVDVSDAAEARGLLARHLHIRGLSRKLADDDKEVR